MKGCISCKTPMVSQRKWREGVRPPGTSAHVGRGLCLRCERREFRGYGEPRHTPVDYEAIAEEWEALADEWETDRTNIANLAPRLGVSRAQLEKIIDRLRRSGRLKRPRTYA